MTTTAKVKIGPPWSKIKKSWTKRCSYEPKKVLVQKYVSTGLNWLAKKPQISGMVL